MTAGRIFELLTPTQRGLAVGFIILILGQGSAVLGQAGRNAEPIQEFRSTQPQGVRQNLNTNANNQLSRQALTNPATSGQTFSSGQASSGSRSIFKRTDQQRNRNNNSRAVGNQQQGMRGRSTQQQSATGINRQEGRQQMRSVRGQAGAGRRSGGAGSTQKPVVVEFTMKANPSTNILYMEGLNGQVPSLNMVAEEGTTFPVRVMFANNRNSLFRDLEVSLKYDAGILEPLAIDDSAIAERLEGESVITHDARRGVIHYKGRFAEAASDSILELFRVEFRAVAATVHSNLTFLNTEANPTRLLNDDGTNVLQLRDEEGELVASERLGLLDASISITPGASTRQALRDEDGTLRGLAMAHSISAGTAEGGISLALVPRQTSARTGETFLVDIQYKNPKGAEMDSVKLRILFDPRVLEVVDWDEGNWITKGINILDGPYQEDLPFDFHRRNVAYNGRGEIQYDAGFKSRTRVPPSGKIATIKFRAKQPVATTAVAFAVDEERPERETSISFLGFNLIGTPGRRGLALSDAVLTIRP
jgi:hypothetical protein